LTNVVRVRFACFAKRKNIRVLQSSHKPIQAVVSMVCNCAAIKVKMVNGSKPFIVVYRSNKTLGKHLKP
jgi:hypothetical protein